MESINEEKNRDIQSQLRISCFVNAQEDLQTRKLFSYKMGHVSEKCTIYAELQLYLYVAEDQMVIICVYHFLFFHSVKCFAFQRSIPVCCLQGQHKVPQC